MYVQGRERKRETLKATFSLLPYPVPHPTSLDSFSFLIWLSKQLRVIIPRLAIHNPPFSMALICFIVLQRAPERAGWEEGLLGDGKLSSFPKALTALLYDNCSVNVKVTASYPIPGGSSVFFPLTNIHQRGQRPNGKNHWTIASCT